MSDIQKARDVLAKYSPYAATAQNWALRGGTDRLTRLITNPDLLDAIDGLLKAATQAGRAETQFLGIDELAAAILAADERMSV